MRQQVLSTQAVAGCGPQDRLRWPRRPGALAGLAVLAGTALLAAACGGQASTVGTAGAGTVKGGTYKQALAYTQCMRAHGVPAFPDPSPQGNFSGSQTRIIAHSVPQAGDANLQCRPLLPNGGFQGSATQLQQYQEQAMRHALKYVACMRTHGFPDFPDPQPAPDGYGVNVNTPSSIDQYSPQYAAADKTCNGPPPP